jgi:dihydrofolate reductase
MRNLILYISCSLDGYIAKSNDDLSFLNLVQIDGEDYGYNNFISTVDTVILGRRTYDWVIGEGHEFPHFDKEVYVITHHEQPAKGNINFYGGDLKKLVLKLKSENGKNIFCDGGAEIVNQLLTYKLFDEIIISIVPIILGDGTRLFKGGRPEQEFKLYETKTYKTGLVQLHYKIA